MKILKKGDVRMKKAGLERIRQHVPAAALGIAVLAALGCACIGVQYTIILGMTALRAYHEFIGKERA